MKLTFATDPAQLTFSPPRYDSGTAAYSTANDREGAPFVLRFETTMAESLTSDDKGSCVNLTLSDDLTLHAFQQLDERILDIVFENHDSDTWFGSKKRLPRAFLAKMCTPVVTHNANNGHPTVRVATNSKDGAPCVVIRTVSEECPDSTTEYTTDTFGALQKTRVVYELQLKGIRFLRKQFVPELCLYRVNTYMSVDDFDFMDGLINNKNHRGIRDKLLDNQKRIAQFESERAQVEALKTEVEGEVAAALTKKDNIEARYKDVLANLEAARKECEMGMGQASEDAAVTVTTTGTDTDTATDTTINTATDTTMGTGTTDLEGIVEITDEEIIRSAV